jgi:ligand-binding sensor domain-containing protein
LRPSSIFFGGLLLAAPLAAPALALDPELATGAIAQRSFQVAEGLDAFPIHDLEQTADGMLWLATGQGLVRFDGRRFDVFDRAEFPALNDDHLHALALDPEGHLFLGTERAGLLRFTGEAFWAVSRPGLGIDPWAVHELAIGPDHVLWVGDPGQLWRLDRAANSVKPSLPGVKVNDLAYDSHGNLWIATSKGIFRRSGSALLPVSLPYGIRADDAATLALDRQDDLWVGGPGKGLSRLTGDLGRGGLPQEVAAEPTFADRRVLTSLVDRRGTLWLGTDEGLYRRHRQSFERIPGPTGRVHCLLEDLQGSLWVGMADRLWQLYAPGTAPLVHAPLLARAEVDGRRVLATDRIDLEPGRHGLRLQLALPMLVPGTETRFRYRLGGVDTDWVESADGVVDLPRLPTGQRLLKAQARIGNGDWQAAELSVALDAPRHWWQDPLLWVAAAAAVATVLWSLRWAFAFFRRPPEDDD